jgi:hypothetical protein
MERIVQCYRAVIVALIAPNESIIGLPRIAAFRSSLRMGA